MLKRWLLVVNCFEPTFAGQLIWAISCTLNNGIRSNYPAVFYDHILEGFWPKPCLSLKEMCWSSDPCCKCMNTFFLYFILFYLFIWNKWDPQGTFYLKGERKPKETEAKKPTWQLGTSSPKGLTSTCDISKRESNRTNHTTTHRRYKKWNRQRESKVHPNVSITTSVSPWELPWQWRCAPCQTS